MNRWTRLTRLLFPVLLWLMAAAPAAAQTGGTFLGAVLDDQGAVLPGAVITFTNLETGFVRTDVTDTQGRFRAAALPPGVYSIAAELAGFSKTVRERCR